jgi:3-methyl-2-oxobutanoate hydroxymethyltransferase
MARISINELKAMKERGEKIPMITAYDYPTARIVEAAGIPMILVGDSLGMVVLGYDSTLPVTLEDMIHHGKAVVRGAQQAIIVVDMPFMTYQVSPEDALRNAGRLMKETGATAVKVEGGESIAPTVKRLVDAGIPVMGHLGLTPQSVNQLGGYKLQGRTPAAVVKLMNDARALERAGAFAIVLETIPAFAAKQISDKVSVPTIGIGAGPYCDGQVQVLHDFLGLYPDFLPRHARRFVDLSSVIDGAVREYVDEVRDGSFPSAKESFGFEKARRAYERPDEESITPYGGGAHSGQTVVSGQTG